ncbi:MAG: diguanylate cyclase [Deltaproteobacteria bacterium]|nr:diguanylate cyclase [Deltaproteobacteria bacterium]
MKQDFDYSQESILIVDDDAVLREVFTDLLKALGFSVASVSSGPEALDSLENNDFTFLLTDMKMPEMDGMELIKRVSGTHPDISIIAMTGYSEGYKYVDVINAGASDFIKKPFDLEELEAKIRRILNERNLRRELNRLSITDSLTGLFNQRHFYDRLKDEMVRARRQKFPLSLILLDLDNFKDYNDTHGHLAGDEVLRSVGRLIQQSIREGVDSAYRYGGDEFAIILVGADLAVAEGIVKRIKESFKAEGDIMASVGYALFEEEMSIKDFVGEADKRLYAAKNARNRSSGD